MQFAIFSCPTCSLVSFLIVFRDYCLQESVNIMISILKFIIGAVIGYAIGFFLVTFLITLFIK